MKCIPDFSLGVMRRKMKQLFSNRIILKITPKLVAALLSILIVPTVVLGANKGYSHLQVKHIIDEGKILGASSKHKEAIDVLLLAEGKWATKSLKEEVSFEIEKNKELLEETQAGETQPTESPTPTLIPNSTRTPHTLKPQTETPTSTLIPTPTPTPAPQSTSQTILQPEVYIIENQPTLQPTLQPTQDYRAACELELQRLLAEYGATEQRYEQYLKDTTQSIIDAKAAEFSRRGIPLSSGAYEQAIADAIAPYVERNRLDKEAALRQIEYQINYLLEADFNCRDLI